MWVLLAALLGAVALWALDRWFPSMWSYVAALGLQAAGLGPMVPTVSDVDEMPLWSISAGYIEFSWAVCVVLLAARIYAAVLIAASMQRDRTGNQEEMLTLAAMP